MAKVVTFTDLVAPSGLSGTAVAGGALVANTTYYYRVIAVYYVGTYAATFYGKSLASNEISVTTTSVNKSVTLTFNHPKGTGGGYRIYRATATGAYLTCLDIALTDTAYNIGGSITWTDNGSVAFSANNAFQNNSHGKVTLSGNTTSDIWSIVDLYNADVAGGWGVITKLASSEYRVNTSVICYALLNWVDEEKVIIFDDFINPNTGNYRFGRLANGATNRGCHIIFKVTALESFAFSTLNAYKTTFDWVLDYNALTSTYNTPLSFLLISFSAGTIQDCQINKLRMFTPSSKVNCILKNVVIDSFATAFGTGLGTFTNVLATNGVCVFQTSNNTVMKAKDVVINTTQYAVLICGTNNVIDMVNTNVAASLYFPLLDSTGGVVNELFTYNLTVYKNDGVTPISGANVKIYDAFNNLICNVNTNVNGVIAEQELIFRKQTYVGTVRTSTNYAPHKLVVSASGYETLTDFKAYTGCVATSHQVGLKPVTKTRYTIEGKPLRALTPESGSSSKLLEI